MPSRKLEVALWACALVSVPVIGLRWSSGHVPVAWAHISTMALRDSSEARSTTGKSTAAGIVAHDPFRLDRSPALVRFSAFEEPAAGMPTRPPTPRPQLVLIGIVGPPWQAVLDGVPGRNGSTVVRPGEEVGPLRIVRISRDKVVVAGLDTTWSLTLRQAWR